MSNSTSTDLQELKELINKRFDKVDEEIEALKKQQAETKESIAEIKGQLKGWEPQVNKIGDLIEKVGELKNWRQIALIAFAAILGWFLRGGKL
ncbi:MAG: hypothetical protein QNJ54_33755 [Prochloraceae cyanobacterium]|nr:hypothetical protein [Prochloraceae cyanobacterium]